MAMKKGMKKAKLPMIKKDINDFLLSEEGKISRKNIAKLGISLAVLGLMFEANNASAQHTNHGQHNSYLYSSGRGGHTSGAPAHVNSHASHGSHSSGGWC